MIYTIESVDNNLMKVEGSPRISTMTQMNNTCSPSAASADLLLPFIRDTATSCSAQKRSHDGETGPALHLIRAPRQTSSSSQHVSEFFFVSGFHALLLFFATNALLLCTVFMTPMPRTFD